MTALADLLRRTGHHDDGYGFAYMDESAKREVRRALVKAVCIPGHHVPFASREMPVARGWGSGGLQVTLALITPSDRLKVIDQGDDDGLNASALRGLIAETTGVSTTTVAQEASVVQTRQRIPEDPLAEEQFLVVQVPVGDPLRVVSPKPAVSRRLHAEGNYEAVWLSLFEATAAHGRSSWSVLHPVEVEDGYLTTCSLPRWDLRRLDDAPFVSLFGLGREAKVFAIPPYTKVVPLAFDDRPFEPEEFAQPCWRCGASDTFLVDQFIDGGNRGVCSDVDHCRRRRGA